MEKFVPYEKLSKKEKRRMDALRRGTWQGLNPVTRKSENPKAYNRRKARQLDMEQCRVFCFAVQKQTVAQMPQT